MGARGRGRTCLCAATARVLVPTLRDQLGEVLIARSIKSWELNANGARDRNRWQIMIHFAGTRIRRQHEAAGVDALFYSRHQAALGDHPSRLRSTG